MQVVAQHNLKQQTNLKASISDGNLAIGASSTALCRPYSSDNVDHPYFIGMKMQRSIEKQLAASELISSVALSETVAVAAQHFSILLAKEQIRCSPCIDTMINIINLEDWLNRAQQTEVYSHQAYVCTIVRLLFETEKILRKRGGNEIEVQKDALQKYTTDA